MENRKNNGVWYLADESWCCTSTVVSRSVSELAGCICVCIGVSAHGTGLFDVCVVDVFFWGERISGEWFGIVECKDVLNV